MNIGQLIADLQMYPPHLEVRVKFWVEDPENGPEYPKQIPVDRVVYEGSYVLIETE